MAEPPSPSSFEEAELEGAQVTQGDEPGDVLSVQQIMDVYREIDESNCGSLRVSDLQRFLVRMQMPSSKKNAQNLYNEILKDAGSAKGAKGAKGAGKPSREISGTCFVAWYRATSMEHPVRDYIRQSKGLASAAPPPGRATKVTGRPGAARSWR